MKDKKVKLLSFCFASIIVGAMFVAGIGAAEPKTAVTFNSITHQSTEYCDFIGSGIKFNGQLPVVQSQLASYQVNLGYTPVPDSRTIALKALTSNIALYGNDILDDSTVGQANIKAALNTIHSSLANYQSNLGYTAENEANKSNDVVADYNSSTKYSTTGSIWTWVKSLLSINEISSVGSGASLYSDRLGDTVRLKSLVQGANIAINSYSDHIEIAGTTTPYTLPIASAGTLGGIKIGSGLSIDGSGVVTASGGSELSIVDLGTSGTQTIDRSLSDKFTITPASAVTLATSNFANMQEAIIQINDGNGKITFPVSWAWKPDFSGSTEVSVLNPEWSTITINSANVSTPPPTLQDYGYDIIKLKNFSYKGNSIISASRVGIYYDRFYRPSSLLLNFNEYPFVDSSPNGGVITNIYGVFDETNKKFGAGGLALTGTNEGGYDTVALTIPEIDAFRPNGKGDFTAEFWVKTTSTIVRGWCVGIWHYGVGDPGGWAIQGSLNSDGEVSQHTNLNGYKTTTGANIADGNWHHVAWVRYNGISNIYIDGVAKITAWADTLDFTTITGTGYFEITENRYNKTQPVYIDCIRLSQFARYLEPFTPSVVELIH